jgi:acid-sensing ion channel, other
MNQVKKNFAESLKTEKDKIILDSICTQGDSLNDDDSNVEGKWSYVREFLLNASQPCEDMIKLCKFGMQKIHCDKSFSSVLTDEGLCCEKRIMKNECFGSENFFLVILGTFNAIHPRLLLKDFEKQDHVDDDVESDISYMTWSPEGGYKKETKKPYPR